MWDENLLFGPGPERLLPGLVFAVEKDSRPAWSEIGGTLKGRQQLSKRTVGLSSRNQAGSPLRLANCLRFRLRAKRVELVEG
jgi:hypothetical protein